MTHQDEIAAKAVRLSTLKSIELKKRLRIKQIKEEAEAKIREINIQYAEDPERLRAKYAADDYARSERAKKRAEKRIEKERKHLAYERKLRKYTLGEEIFSAIVQGIGFCIFIAATVLLDVVALGRVPEEKINMYLIMYTSFGGTMILNYLMSILHHSLTNYSAKEVFKRLCHCGVFLTIGSIYTFYAFISEGSLFVWGVIGVVLAVCLTGFFMYAIAGTRLEIVNIILYAVLGCAAFFIIDKIFNTVSKQAFALMITAGALYVIGLVFCSLRKVKYMHAIGDLILLLASTTLFFSFFTIN